MTLLRANPRNGKLCATHKMTVLIDGTAQKRYQRIESKIISSFLSLSVVHSTHHFSHCCMEESFCAPYKWNWVRTSFKQMCQLFKYISFFHDRTLQPTTCLKSNPCEPNCFKPICNSRGKCWCDRTARRRY